MVNQFGADVNGDQLFMAMLKFNRAFRAMNYRRSTEVKSYQITDRLLTSADIAIMRVLLDDGGQRCGVLAQRVGVGPSVISRQLTGLVKAHLVAREQDSTDRRAETITITERGEMCLAQLRRDYLSFMRERFSAWDETKLATAVELMEELAEMVVDR